MVYHCLFEQSGIFKNELKKLGYNAYDYDILNDYNETDYVIDLFEEIEKAYGGGSSIFDKMKGDTAFAFFPCTMFENQIELHFRGTAWQMSKWTDEQKLENNLKLHKQLSHNYEAITKLALVCIRKEIKLIIENPFSTTHYLYKYWPIPYTFVDYDRRENGDYFKKPTQYWFIGRKPSNNLVFEPIVVQEKKEIIYTSDRRERSLISKEYANRFIREFVI